MAKIKTRDITIYNTKGTFSLFKKDRSSKKDYDFSGLQALRNLITDEKARIIDVIKNQNPTSIYDLAKKLNRNIRAVRQDLKLLERFGFVEFIQEKKNNRVLHRPIIVTDSMVININI